MTSALRKAMQLCAKKLRESNATNPNAIKEAVKAVHETRKSITLRAVS